MDKIATQKGEILIFDNKNKVFSDPIEIIEVLFSEDAETIVLDMTNLPETFFDLKTKFAGEVLQKIINYQRRIIILGEFEKFNSNSLNDFIYESNKVGKIIFSDNIDNAIKLLK